MKFSPLHASLLALVVVAYPAAAMAASAGSQPPIIVAQAETGADTQDVEVVRKFLANNKDLSQLDEDKLRQKLKRARRLSQKGDLPPDLQSALQQQIAALESEIARRGQSSASSTPEAGQPQGQAPKAGAAPQAGGAGTGDVAAFLQSVRPASELNDKEIRRQVKQAVQFAKTEGISKEQRQALRQVIREGRAALKDTGGDNEGQAGGAGTPPQPPQQHAGQGAEQGGGQPPPEGQQPPQQPGKVNPALEQQAQAMLKDNADVRAMKQPELRKRLTGMRDLLASGELSPQTADALRAKLASERQVLRNQVSATGSGSEPPKPQPPQAGGNNSGSTPPPGRGGGGKGPDIDITIVLGDMRPPNALRDDELVRRIDVYRVAVDDRRYSQIERERWRRQMERDRMFLRQRMLEERRQREARLRSGDVEFNIVIEDRYVPGRRPPPPSVFAAEVEDQELADILAAPPRRQIDRRYTVEEIEQSPQARDAVARIEIDTVHFGFGESFLREEEIDKLDRIARILERILAEHPDEVFLLEGHTDAVGTDEANLQLSRERAKAVKEALVTYYVIPAQNLKTVGLGERYLKIPTNEPEAENRRVSLARITPLVGEAQ